MTAALLPVPGQTWVDGDGHSWCDDGACVDVRLPVGDATLEALQQRLRIRVGPTSLRVELDGQAEPLLDVAELHAECLPHQTAWNLDEARRAVVVRLTKRDVTVPWSSLDAHGGGVDAGAALATRAKVEALLRAAADGDEAALRTAATQLDDGEGAVAVVAAVKDGNARGALHFAALRGHAELCTVLVREFGMAPDARDADGAHTESRQRVMQHENVLTRRNRVHRGHPACACGAWRLRGGRLRTACRGRRRPRRRRARWAANPPRRRGGQRATASRALGGGRVGRRPVAGGASVALGRR